MRSWIIACSVMWMVLGAASCGSETATCGTSADCNEGQVCDKGSCVVPSFVMCMGDPDCSPGNSCQQGTCQPLPRFDMGNNTNNSEPDMTVEPDLPVEDLTPPDNVNPTVVSITPAQGATEIALDAEVKVVFSEEMDPATINFQSLVLKNPTGRDVEATVTYDATTMTATLKPTAPLYASTGYRVVPTEYLRDLAANSLRTTPSPEVTFYTTLALPEDHTALALEFAPAIFQSLETIDPGLRNVDTPTTVDFDGDTIARNNKVNGLRTTAQPRANVYYSVVESQTHWFITYALYYPVRREKTLDVNYEHDFTGAVFVVEKATRTLKLVEGLQIEEGADTVVAYKPSQSAVDKTQDTVLESVDEADYVDGRYPMLITSGSHQTCHWVKRGPTLPAVCRHESRQFSEGPTAGVLMKPGVAQFYNESLLNETTGIREMEYALVPMASLWAKRGEVGEELMWENLTVYNPYNPDNDRPVRTPDDSPVVVPTKLFSNDTMSFGKPPFAWGKLAAYSNQGQWLFDPAYLLQVRYNFGQNFSADYCHNVFMAIDQRTTAPCMAEEEGT